MTTFMPILWFGFGHKKEIIESLNFPLTSHVVRSVGWFHNILKRQAVTLPCSYRSTKNLNGHRIQIHFVFIVKSSRKACVQILTN